MFYCNRAEHTTDVYFDCESLNSTVGFHISSLSLSTAEARISSYTIHSRQDGDHLDVNSRLGWRDDKHYKLYLTFFDQSIENLDYIRLISQIYIDTEQVTFDY